MGTKVHVLARRFVHYWQHVIFSSVIYTSTAYNAVEIITYNYICIHTNETAYPHILTITRHILTCSTLQS